MAVARGPSLSTDWGQPGNVLILQKALTVPVCLYAVMRSNLQLRVALGPMSIRIQDDDEYP